MEDQNKDDSNTIPALLLTPANEASDSSSHTSLSTLYTSNEDDDLPTLLGRPTSPANWMTTSDTAVTPGAVGLIKAVIESHDIPSPLLSTEVGYPGPLRFLSVPNLDDEMDKHTDDDIRRMRDRLLVFARKENRKLIKQMTRTQKLTLFAIALCYFMSYCSISVLAPFFTQVVHSKGLSISTSGMVFSIHALVVFCMSPFLGRIIPTVGPKFLFISGVFLSGSCNLLFGTLEYIDDNTQFMVYCFIVRGMAAIGAAGFSTAGATFVADLFPDKIGAVMGILETFVGLGFSVGPAVGGALYTLGGFSLPFYTLGALMLITVPFTMFLLPATQHNVREKLSTSFTMMFKNPGIFVVCLVITVASSAWSVMDPTLGIHLKQFNLTANQLGLLFLLTSATYALSSPLWGWIVDKYHIGNVMMFAGLCLSSFSLLLLGPSPVLGNLPNVLWLNILSLVLLGMCVALSYIPTYHALLHYAVSSGCAAQLSTYGLVAGLWSSMYSLGEVIGPTVGSLLVDFYSFPISMTVMGLLNLGVALLLLLHQSYVRLRERRAAKPAKLDEDALPALNLFLGDEAGELPEGLSCKIGQGSRAGSPKDTDGLLSSTPKDKNYGSSNI